ncbi:usherin [Pelodytes ibericus]
MHRSLEERSAYTSMRLISQDTPPGMDILVWAKELGRLIRVLHPLIVFGCSYLPAVRTQGHFPKLENIGAFVPVSTDPIQATCGFPDRSVFCKSENDIEAFQTCTQGLCIQECPYRSSSPGYRDLLLVDLGPCIRKDKNDLRPGSSENSASYIFYNHKDCFVTLPIPKVGNSFTLTVWLKPEQEREMCVIEKSADGEIVFKLTISEKATVFYYRTVNGFQPPIKVMTQGRFPVKKWIHLSVQVHHTSISFFINGLQDHGAGLDSGILSGPVSDTVFNSSIVLGQNIYGSEQFIGRIQDFRLYEQVLTNREIMEVFSEEFPPLHVQSVCRCPASHPRVHPTFQRHCIPNGIGDTSKDRVLRLNPDSHPISYVNDKDLETTWISSLLSSADIDTGITITMDLLSGQYQVFYVIIQFYSLMPKAIKLQRKKHRNSTWEDWQYFASDCQYFGMENNGALEYPDSINCQRLPKNTPYSRGNVTFSILKPEPSDRPGYNDFYHTPSLQEFVKASGLRIHMTGQYHVERSDTFNISRWHRYYGISEITISGRCICHGHAKYCKETASSYKCHCDVQSYTTGNNCDQCLPLFNDKPFRQGDQVHAYNCRPCQCYNHSFTCHYDAALDPYPYSHDRGGGGVCDNCLHHTTGRSCEWCEELFYRDTNANLSATDVCKPCNCTTSGTVNGDMGCEKIGGQCNCKPNIVGRQCNQCKDGFYNVQSTDHYGCQPCKCNRSGTINGSVTCQQNTGQCKCKPNVTGLQCDRCILGFKQHNPLGEESCEPCKCSTNGSINQFCNPISGQCKCREDVKGLACDTCIDNYYGLDTDVCKHCDCYREGIIPGTVCDAVAGQCVCQPNIGGRRCDECLTGYYQVKHSHPMVCLPCQCDMSGTMNGSPSCDNSTGQCLCKDFVTGKRCNRCKDHTYNLTTDNVRGCQSCDCSPLGTLANISCDPANGQCKCLPHYQGRRCNECKTGFYLSAVHGMRCIPCLCHPKGSISEICNKTDGQCVCQDPSITGHRCDQCQDSFYGFSLDIGRCQPCHCSEAGAVNGSCHSVSGQCFCKQFVRGVSCDRCMEDASRLDAQNQFGCSTTPNQQPPPRGDVLNSTTIKLTWNPPDSPNSNKINYILYRDGLEIYNTTDDLPYGLQSFTDTSLSPHTKYTYHVEARNVHGFVNSVKVVYRTKAGPPTGEIYLGHSNLADPYSATLNWTIPSDESGPIEEFRLMYTSIDSAQPKMCYRGSDTSVTVPNLVPFTRYTFLVEACTSEGCLQSSPVAVVTPQAPPKHQDPPVLLNSTFTEFHLKWIPPSRPNGIIIRYEVYMRTVQQIHGSHIPVETRVFHTTGWLNPQPVVESENENALKPPATNAFIGNLEPNTEYEFCIVAANMAGSVTSEWVTMKTEEAVPAFMPPPSVLPVSSCSLNVSWGKPANSAARGKITGFTINVLSEEAFKRSNASSEYEVLHIAEDNELFYEVTGLKPYQVYSFTVTLCNKLGCVTSSPGVAQTLSSAPDKLSPPLVYGINSTVMKLAWAAPGDLNGPSPVYRLERIDSSLAMSSRMDFVKGMRFPGNSYVKFTPPTLPVNTYFTVQSRPTEKMHKVTQVFIKYGISCDIQYISLNHAGSVVGIQGSLFKFTGALSIQRRIISVFRGGESQYSEEENLIIQRRRISVFRGGESQYSEEENLSIQRRRISVFRGGESQYSEEENLSIQRRRISVFRGGESQYSEEENLSIQRRRISVFRGGGSQYSEEENPILRKLFLDGEGIKLQFRTKEPNGLILCAISAGMQEEYIVLQIRKGRPYFLFDPQGSAVAVSPTDDGHRTYNDNSWHEIIARRNHAAGSISVDDQYSGSSSATSGSTIIGENTGVFVGGFPRNFSMKRNDGGDMQITREHFVGCLGEIFILKSANPGEIWEALDWRSTEEATNVYEKWEGCPDCTEDGAHFLGFGFLELNPIVFPAEPDFELSFLFKTDQLKGLLLFTYNADRTEYFIAQLNNGILNIKVKNKSTLTKLNLWAGISYCDGRWNSVYFKKEGALYLFQLNNLVERVAESGPVPYNTNISSAVFVGGLPEYVRHLFSDLDLQQGFGGCLKDLSFTKGVVVNFASASLSAVRVNLDGCPSTDSTINCRGNDSIIVYRGEAQTVSEHDLQPFTEYLYRVIASNDGGSRASPWSRGRTRAAVPQNVKAPLRVLNINGYSVEVTWSRPSGVRGVIEQYLLKAYPESSPNIFTSSAAFPDIGKVNGTLKGLVPFTRYIVTLSVCSLAGCSDNSHALNISTMEEVPEDVQMPSAESFPNSLHLHWSAPKKPNGVITHYILYMDGTQIYTGNEREHNVTGLGIFTPHQFQLTACTCIGCSNSTQVTLYTAQIPPHYMFPPFLSVLDSTSIYVQWREPEKTHGILERYEILISNNISYWDVVYNSTELFLDYTIRELTPGTTYFIKIRACTAGGCTASQSSTATTEESLPEDVQTPEIQSHSSDSFNISWSKPLHPNGVITGYGLSMDGILLHNSSQCSSFVEGLSPWSKHSFRLQACTAKGCALGNKVDAYTLESEPEGNIMVRVITDGPRGIQVKWQGPEKPNGNLTYNVLFNGLFYEMEGYEIYGIVNSTKTLIRSHTSSTWVSTGGLVPFSDYIIWINASNSQGFVISDPIQVTLPPGAPDGVLPPRPSSATPTSLQVCWSTPVRNNAPGFPKYRLQMRSRNATNEIIDLFSGPAASFTYTVTDLQPFTVYELRIVAFNRYGATDSDWIAMSTEEDKPGPIDPPLFSNVKSRSLTITWQHPSQPNGRITHYNIYQNGSLQAAVPGNSSSYDIQNLSPYTTYQFQLEGCTSRGCSISVEPSQVQTRPDSPSEIPPPDLYSDTPTSVVVKWKPPVYPNGLIENYTIERRAKGEDQLYKLVTLPKNNPMQYTDQTTDISPWKTYEYRIEVTTTDGGTNTSAWSEVTTRPSRPVGIQPPEVNVLGPYTAKISWKAPLIPNGDILSYEIRMPEPQITIINTMLLNYTVTNLIPYTNYSVTIVVCSGGGIYHGGCVESVPRYASTPPALPQGISPLSATPISETCVVLSWQTPSRPNGPNLRYELLRCKILQPLTSNPPEDLNLWQNIYSGTQWFYEDKGLSRYTTYKYRLIVHNVVGHTPSTDVTMTTMAGPPIRGCSVTALATNHTAIEVKWSKPTVQDLQGDVQLYTLLLNSSVSTETLTFRADVNSSVIGGLVPNTKYRLSLQVFNGAHSINSDLIHVTTLDGVPEGIFPPEVDIINGTALRVVWTSPSQPNGVVTEYSIHVNNKVYKTGMSSPGIFVLGDLLPYTVYNVQMEVCTIYACVQSNGTRITTVEGKPGKIKAPTFKNVNSRSVEMFWTLPQEPNGILLGFDLRRKTLRSCGFFPKLARDHGPKSCVFLKCDKNEEVCGDICYSPDNQECCGGVLYDRRAGYQCSEDEYIVTSPNTSVVHCGGRRYHILPEHQCCGRYYTRVQAGEVCCYSTAENRVAVGDGDFCCGEIPYVKSRNQICCGESLYDRFDHQCCGGKITGLNVICCGDEKEGTTHWPSSGLGCCGTEYVNISESICCSDSSGQFKVHLKSHDQKPLKCCQTQLIPENAECCNGLGYDPLIHVCANKISWGIYSKEEKCHLDVLCPISLSASAYCGQCSFNPATDSCHKSKTPLDIISNTESREEDVCPTEEEIIYIGGPDKHSFIDIDLEPFTTYEYRLSTWNSYSRGFSDFTRVTTTQDRPQGVSPPRWTAIDNREDMISLSWEEPYKPNGIIHYVIVRDGAERFKGVSQHFLDKEGIQPFHEYAYQLQACTVAGCLASAKVFAAIKHGVPEDVSPPVITVVNSTALHLSWSTPKKNNGHIKLYKINGDDGEVISVSTEQSNQYTVTGLQPYRRYSFSLTLCTSSGCTSSQPSSGLTMQDAPQGVWSKPRHVTINSTALELYWDEPETSNGIILQYRVVRDGGSISSRSREYLSYTDVGLQPSSRYLYQLEASTEGGNNISEIYTIETPAFTPEDIPAPYNVTVLGPYTTYVAWDSPVCHYTQDHVNTWPDKLKNVAFGSRTLYEPAHGMNKQALPCVFDPRVPLDFNILLNAGRMDSDVRSAGEEDYILLENLSPYTRYEIRIQACQNGSCGVGSPVSTVTQEAAPEELDPPLMSAIGPRSIRVIWRPPKKANGIISTYFIDRRLADHLEITAVFTRTDGTLEYVDGSHALLPYTAYQYRITAQNSKGSVKSAWSQMYTLEAEPQDMEPPRAQATSAYSVYVNWVPPLHPNGVIKHYRIVYQEISTSSTKAITVLGTVHHAKIFGLSPSTTYQICIEASNSVGEVLSPWTFIQTHEAPPGGLYSITVEKKEDGRALLLQWSEPRRTNGVLQIYNIYSDGHLEYSGLGRQFLLRRLEPYTVYTLELEACTAAGCSWTLPQLIQTEESTPASQLPPSVESINSTRVALSWSPPVYPNGQMKRYDVIKRCRQGRCPGTEKNMDGKIVHTEHNTKGNTFSYIDDRLRPWTSYEYKIRAWNSAGSTESTWIMAQTSQAAPTNLLPPKLSHMENSPNQLLIEWSPPEEDTGKIQSYRLQRNGILFSFSFDSSTFNYTDGNLLAYSDYNYSVVACTVGGCATSLPTSIRTLEAPPTSVSPPDIQLLRATEINITWSPPLIQNGEITKYIIEMDGENYFAGKRLSRVLSNLEPFTLYNISLLACTNGGCTSSLPTVFRTMEDSPADMKAPTFMVAGAESIEIMWQTPEKPNGEIKSYELRRDGVLIYVGLDTHYHDFGLDPGTEYVYSVQAQNNHGSSLRSSARIKTHPSAPSGMEPPQMEVESPYEMLVTWRPPTRANGDIINYTLSIRCPIEMEVKRYHFNNTSSPRMIHSFAVKDLRPYNQYEAKVEACTLLGCAVSEWVTGNTLEAPPESQPAPLIDLQANQQEPLIMWNIPQQPNGKILHFKLYRRNIGHNVTALVYNGSVTSYRDERLLPYTDYEYQVWAVNSAGERSSPWVSCRTGPAAPEGIPEPTIESVSATLAVVNILTPSKPNGIITLYRLFSTDDKGADIVLSEGTSNQQIIYGLKPFTNYSAGVEACTCLTCCGRGPVVRLTTLPAPPSHQLPPHVTSRASRAISLQWNRPLSPNGIIQRYEVHMQVTCPQPNQIAGPPCTPGQLEEKCQGRGERCNVSNLLPYTCYRIRVVSHNTAGSAVSGWINCTTLKEKPEYKSNFIVLSNITTLFLDWSLTFQLNGQLKEFALTERGQRLYSGLDSAIYIQRTADKTLLFQVTCTTDMGSASSPVVKYNFESGLAPVQPFPSGKNGTEEREIIFYNELWFIILIALLGLLLLALVLSLLLQRKIRKQPYPRERPPLVPLQQRTSPASGYSQSENFTCDPVAVVSGTSNLVTLKSYIMHSEGISEIKIPALDPDTGHGTTMVRKTSHSQISHSFSQNSLYRSASQLITSHDKKSSVDGSIWDSVIQGHDSGMYVDDEDLLSTIKSFSTVSKQHTAFTDTPL